LRLLVNSLLVEILDLLDRQWVPLDVELTSTKRNVQLFLQDLRGSAEQYWTLQKMADTCDLGRTQFAKHCKDLTNMSPVEYLQSCRIEKAKSPLLGDVENCITDIAADCGFDSSQYFSNTFRKVVGCSPREFRHSVLRAA
jgi:AraC family L-rhamnose operon regulatory protein RhaS